MTPPGANDVDKSERRPLDILNNQPPTKVHKTSTSPSDDSMANACSKVDVAYILFKIERPSVTTLLIAVAFARS